MKKLFIVLLIFCLTGCGYPFYSFSGKVYKWAKEYIESNIKPNWEYDIAFFYNLELIGKNKEI